MVDGRAYRLSCQLILSDLQCTVNEDIFEKSTGGGQDKGGYLHQGDRGLEGR